uniref:Flavin-containing monooxygenase n=1 Tax=Oryza barthii TaxID=65489 RepID=A0A0D3GLH7_9ORYZ
MRKEEEAAALGTNPLPSFAPDVGAGGTNSTGRSLPRSGRKRGAGQQRRQRWRSPRPRTAAPDEGGEPSAGGGCRRRRVAPDFSSVSSLYFHGQAADPLGFSQAMVSDHDDGKLPAQWKKVCVVGGGMAGLAAARELRREGLDVTVLEQRGGVGGQWLYDAATDPGDPLGMAGVHSSVFASLRLNSPRESIGFSDFPFRPTNDAGGDARRYPVHGELLRYIRDFCDAFGLMDAVRLNTTVTRVAMAPPRRDGSLRWAVRSRRHGEAETEEVFDAVVVAIGHYSQPRLPTVDGMDRWRRKQLHSHSYRVPDSFAGEVVVIVGCSVSGAELALELRRVAKEVHLSTKSTEETITSAIVSGAELALELRRVAKEVHLSTKSTEETITSAMSKSVARYENLHLRPQVEHLREDGTVVFDDGSFVVADAIIYCTGYNYSFPFLDTNGKVTVDDNRVGPLYEHVFPPELAPSLSFVGIPAKVLLPVFIEVQARWVAQVLSGRRTLPSQEEMQRAVEELSRGMEAAGLPKRWTHDMFLDLERCDDYGERTCGFPRMEQWKKEIFFSSLSDMVDDMESFRDGYHDSDLVRDGLRRHDWTPVCVIGAGVSGLAAARELRREGLDVTVLEQRGGVGGQWLYDTATDAGDPLGVAGVHSSMEVMGFSDFPFRPGKDGAGAGEVDARRFPGHAEFLRYIREFCDVFGLMDAVRLNTTVTRVAMAPPRRDGSLRWAVRSKHRGEEAETEEVFDAVVVASGHFCQPRLPTIDGMDRWRRRQLHSHSYRVPDAFHGEVVVIVGCSISGKDIGLELRRVAKEVHLSAKSPEEAMTPAMSKILTRYDNLHLHPQIEHLREDGTVVFVDGTCVVADTVVYCTGYTYSYPFLDTDGKVTVDDNRVGPLFDHVFPPELAPSLSFVGIPAMVVVPLFNEVQARWVAQVLSGRRALPSPEEMARAAEEYNRGREAAGVAKRRTHDILDLEYCDDYGERNCGFPRLEAWKKELMWSSYLTMCDNLETFRDDYHDSDLMVSDHDDGKPPAKWKKVCVVGAGMAGLAATRELRREGHAVTVLEQAGDVGGQWLYDPRTDDPLGASMAPVRVHSSMYASLRLISPRETMGFTDFPFLPVDGGGGGGGRDPRRFPGHREVLLYLKDFCDAFGLMDAVRLNTRVLRVAMAPPQCVAPAVAGGERKWVVTSVRVGERDDTGVEEEVFDAVVVATGHYSQPSLPTIKGMEAGKDIALDLISVAKEVHLTAKSTEEATTPALSKLLAKYANLHLRPRVEHLCEDGTVVFVDGSRVVADTVMYCTGYVYSFPFLDTDGVVTVDDNRVGPLFEHVFPPALAPSLSFVGVPRKVPAPWFFEAQGKWVAQVLSGRRTLPPVEEMLRAVDEHYRARAAAGLPVKYTHELGGIEPQKYIEFGEKYCGFPRYEDWKREMIVSAIRRRDDDDMETFRDRVDDDSDHARVCLKSWHCSSTARHQASVAVSAADGHPPPPRLAQTAMAMATDAL